MRSNSLKNIDKHSLNIDVTDEVESDVPHHHLHSPQPEAAAKAAAKAAKTQLTNSWHKHRRIIYIVNICGVTGNFFMDYFLDLLLIWTFHENNEPFFGNVSTALMVFSSLVIAFTAMMDVRAHQPPQGQPQRSAIFAGLLGFSRFELLYEALRSLNEKRIGRGYGTRRYYQIKFWTGVSASAPQAVLQTFILITTPNGEGHTGNRSLGMQVVLQLSILSAMLSLTYIAYEKDHWFVKEHRHQIEHKDKHLYTMAAIGFRLCEVCSRATALAFAAMLVPFSVYIAFIALDVCLVAALFTRTQIRSLKRRNQSDGQDAQVMIRERSLICIVAFYAPCAVVIWPLALLECRKGLKNDVTTFYLMRFGQALGIGILTILNFQLEFSRFNNALLSDHLPVLTLWAMTTCAMPFLFCNVNHRGKKLIPDHKAIAQSEEHTGGRHHFQDLALAHYLHGKDDEDEEAVDVVFDDQSMTDDDSTLGSSEMLGVAQALDMKRRKLAHSLTVEEAGDSSPGAAHRLIKLSKDAEKEARDAWKATPKGTAKGIAKSIV
jgi:hypothetical protein